MPSPNDIGLANLTPDEIRAKLDSLNVESSFLKSLLKLVERRDIAIRLGIPTRHKSRQRKAAASV